MAHPGFSMQNFVQITEPYSRAALGGLAEAIHWVPVVKFEVGTAESSQETAVCVPLHSRILNPSLQCNDVLQVMHVCRCTCVSVFAKRYV